MWKYAWNQPHTLSFLKCLYSVALSAKVNFSPFVAWVKGGEHWGGSWKLPADSGSATAWGGLGDAFLTL